MVINVRKFSMRLAGLINELNLHYSDLETLSGVHAITISKYANNKITQTRTATYDNVNKLANALDVNPHWLAGEEGQPRTLNQPNPPGGALSAKRKRSPRRAAPSPLPRHGLKWATQCT